MGLFDLFSNSDAQSAADHQIAGITSGLTGLNKYFGAGRDALSSNFTQGLQPFLQNYSNSTTGTGALADALGLNGAAGNARATAAFNNNPATQSQIQVGDAAINAADAASGKLASGQQMMDLSKYNQGIVNQNWNQYIQSLTPYLNQANTAASGIGTMYSGLGSGLNNSFQTQGNATYGANTSIGNAQANADLANYNASGNMLGATLGLGKALFGFGVPS